MACLHLLCSLCLSLAAMINLRLQRKDVEVEVRLLVATLLRVELKRESRCLGPPRLLGLTGPAPGKMALGPRLL